MKNPRPQSNNHRHAYLCKSKTVEETRLALENALSHHDMLRTLAIHYDASTPLHIVLRPSSTWFQHCITILDEPIDTAADLKRLLWNDPQYDFAAYPGPMFRAVVTHVREENCAGLVYMIQHSVFDGISLEFFLQDLDALLVAGNNTATSSSSLIPQRIPFRAWIESEFHFRNSLAAQTSVQWHVNRLRGIHTHHAALFPRQKAPEWFKGDSTGWIDESTGKPGPERKLASSEEEKENQKEEANGVTGLSQKISLPDMQHLKHTHGIDASTVMKAALAMLNTKVTGHKVALFAEYFAARNSWPYLPEWMSSVLPEPMEVDGPTVQKVVVAIEVPLTGGAGEEEGEEGEGEGGSSILEFLLKLQKEQDLMKKYVHAPFRDVIDGLHDTNTTTTNNTTNTNTTNDARNARNAATADAKTTLSISRRQIFNWLPSSSSSHHHLSKIQQISRTDCGLLWNFLQLPPTSSTSSANTNNTNTKNHTTNSSDDKNDNENDKNDAVKICIMPSWDDAQLTCREVSDWMEQLGNLAERISRRENWGRGVGLVG